MLDSSDLWFGNTGEIHFCNFRIVHVPRQAEALGGMISRACTVAQLAPIWSDGGDREAVILQALGVIRRGNGPSKQELRRWAGSSPPFLVPMNPAEEAMDYLVIAAATAATVMIPELQNSEFLDPIVAMVAIERMLGQLLTMRAERTTGAMLAYKLELKAIFKSWIEFE